jgi:hypothetical protein
VITPLKKQMMSPIASMPCPNCDKDVGVPTWMWWIYLPFLVALVVTYFIDSDAVSWSIWGVATLVFLWLNHAMVPLIAK